jgi:CheY-like chemotaxis protein
VDDCRDGADTCATLLRLWGHDARVAYDGPAAVRAAELFRPDAFLLDVALPGIDGCGLARQFRREADFRDALLIAVSGYADPAHRKLGDEAGFDHYLIKPVEPTVLQQLLECFAAGDHPRAGPRSRT